MHSIRRNRIITRPRLPVPSSLATDVLAQADNLSEEQQRELAKSQFALTFTMLEQKADDDDDEAKLESGQRIRSIMERFGRR